MSQLPKELQERLGTLVLDPSEEDGALYLSAEDIDQVAAAFADAGYIRPTVVGTDTPLRDVLMSGQEWYERFVKELKLESPDLNEVTAIETLLAAKRAAGLYA